MGEAAWEGVEPDPNSHPLATQPQSRVLQASKQQAQVQGTLFGLGWAYPGARGNVVSSSAALTCWPACSSTR